MATKSSGRSAGSTKAAKAAQRHKTHNGRTVGAHSRAAHRGRFSRLNVIGGIVTVLVVVGVVGWAVLRSYVVTTATPSALANPNALNPSPQLLSTGSTAPGFTLRDAAGKAYTLAAQR